MNYLFACVCADALYVAHKKYAHISVIFSTLDLRMKTIPHIDGLSQDCGM